MTASGFTLGHKAVGMALSHATLHGGILFIPANHNRIIERVNPGSNDTIFVRLEGVHGVILEWIGKETVVVPCLPSGLGVAEMSGVVLKERVVEPKLGICWNRSGGGGRVAVSMWITQRVVRSIWPTAIIIVVVIIVSMVMVELIAKMIRFMVGIVILESVDCVLDCMIADVFCWIRALAPTLPQIYRYILF